MFEKFSLNKQKICKKNYVIFFYFQALQVRFWYIKKFLNLESNCFQKHFLKKNVFFEVVIIWGSNFENKFFWESFS